MHGKERTILIRKGTGQDKGIELKALEWTSNAFLFIKSLEKRQIQYILEKRCPVPKQVLPDAIGFAWLSRRFVRLGFRPTSRLELGKCFERLGLVAPRHRRGREVGFTFHANGLTVVAWTTWLRQEEMAREEDSGWVVIRDGDEAVYFSHDIRRTKNFLSRLLIQARLAQLRVLNRPICPECHKFMDITNGMALKSRYWRCALRENHENHKVTRRSWDFGLPPKAIKFVQAERRRRSKEKEKRLREGKGPIIPALLRRKSWKKSVNRASAS